MAPRKAPAAGGRSLEGGGGLRSGHVPDGKKTADRAEEEQAIEQAGAAFHLRAAGWCRLSTRRAECGNALSRSPHVGPRPGHPPL